MKKLVILNNMKYVCIKEFDVSITNTGCFRIFQIGERVKIHRLCAMPDNAIIYNDNVRDFDNFDCLVISLHYNISEYFITLAEYRNIKIDEILK